MNWLAYYVHNLDPVIFHVGPFGPRWYGFAYLMGFLGAYLLILKLARDGMLRLPVAQVPDLVLNCCIFGVLLGGRMGFVLFYDLPDALRHGRTPMLWDFSATFPFWAVLRVWEGGMSAHGGVLFTVLTLMFFAWRRRKQGVSLINIGDAACMVVPVGLCFGRIANFVNGELYGHVSRVPWAVKFPSEIYSPTNNIPTIPEAALYPLQQGVTDFLRDHAQLLSRAQVEAFLSHDQTFKERIISAVGDIHLESPTQFSQIQQQIAHYLSFDSRNLNAWDIGSWWQGAHNAVTDVMFPYFDAILPARHPSQLYESLLEGVLLFAICWTIGRKWRKEGMASGAFLTLYPVMRIIGEQFRVGDSPRNILGIDMSLGVIYSLLMFVGGAIYWAYWIKRDKRVPWIRVSDWPASPAPPASAAPSAAPPAPPGAESKAT